ncbi:hypothetical protein SH139x_003978 [Planctomycetaceae bacterium SH139]
MDLRKIRTNRWLALSCGILLWQTLASPSWAEDASVEPYRAFVAREGEFTRCGPAGEFYQADPLRAGEEVEVYLETEDGWLGIRPPENSFCWIQSDQIRVDEDATTGTVVDAAAVAWIGTHLGRAKTYRWQVRLERGETVTIIGTARRQGPEGDDVWYRIVPPAGEFRWVHKSQVVATFAEVQLAAATDSLDTDRQFSPNRKPDRDSPGSSRRRLLSEDRENIRPREPLQDPLESDPRERSVLEDGPIGSGLANSNLKLLDQVSLEDISLDDTLAELRRPEPPAGTLRAINDVANPLLEHEPIRPTAAIDADKNPLRTAMRNELISPRFQPTDELASLDVEGLRMELSRAMARRARAAETEQLRRRAAQLALESTNSIERGRASILLKRIEEYQLVASRRDDQRAPASTQAAPARLEIPTPNPAAQSAAQPAAGLAGVNTSLETPAVAENRIGAAAPRAASFDRQGWLVRVYSARPSAPPYALTDTAGNTLSYITPVPGLNLRRYLNQEVGVYGRTSADTSLETPHLIAEQAVRLRR